MSFLLSSCTFNMERGHCLQSEKLSSVTAVKRIELNHAKPGLEIFVIVIPKEGLGGLVCQQSHSM